MSKPRLLDAYTKDSSTITAVNADYAEIGEWSDGNPGNENRIGYFVSVAESEAGITMIKSTSRKNVRGVTVEYPGFSTNADKNKFDESGYLLPRYSYVGLIGFVSVIDNGTCVVNERCMPADDGTAVPSSNELGYQVIDRIDANHVLILVEPQGDALQRVKENLDYITQNLWEGNALASLTTSDGKTLMTSDDKELLGTRRLVFADDERITYVETMMGGTQ